MLNLETAATAFRESASKLRRLLLRHHPAFRWSLLPCVLVFFGSFGFSPFGRLQVLHQTSKPLPGYDYFLLALTWPNGFCKEEGKTCKPSLPKQYITIHGLWPQNNQGLSPTFCEAEQVTDNTLNQLRDGLMQYWPRLFSASDFQRSKALWISQWNKHGSCSANKFPPPSYFQNAIALERTYGAKILEVLKNEGIKPDGETQYNSTGVLNAIKKATNKYALLSCTKDKSGKLQLSEVRLCFNDDAKTIKDCTGRSPSCNQPFLFASPP